MQLPPSKLGKANHLPLFWVLTYLLPNKIKNKHLKKKKKDPKQNKTNFLKVYPSWVKWYDHGRTINNLNSKLDIVIDPVHCTNNEISDILSFPLQEIVEHEHIILAGDSDPRS